MSWRALLFAFLLSVPIIAEPVLGPVQFRKGPGENRYFGRLEFICGRKMASDTQIEGIGGVHLRDSEAWGVTEQGRWFRASLSSNLNLTNLIGGVIPGLGTKQPEALAIDRQTGTAILALEDGFGRKHDIVSSEHPFETPAEIRLQQLSSALTTQLAMAPASQLAPNQGVEALAILSDSRLLVIPEGVYDTQINAFILDRQSQEISNVTFGRTDGFDISDAAVMPNGDVLLLERALDETVDPEVSWMRLRLVTNQELSQTEVVEGSILLTASSTEFEVDAMEALAISQEAGRTYVTIFSDNRHRSCIKPVLILRFSIQ